MRADETAIVGGAYGERKAAIAGVEYDAIIFKQFRGGVDWKLKELPKWRHGAGQDTRGQLAYLDFAGEADVTRFKVLLDDFAIEFTVGGEDQHDK